MPFQLPEGLRYLHNVMKTDQDLFNEFREKNGNARLYPEEKILQLMASARKEVNNDIKAKMPKMETLKDEFKAILQQVKDDPEKRACYNRLTQDKVFWVWFTQGAAAVLKRFKTE